MRTITKESIDAFYKMKKFKKRNMEVEISSTCINLKLHGHTIAELDINGDLYISTCGYNTVTTRDRLNGLEGVHITCIKRELKLNGYPWNGELKQIYDNRN